MPPGATTRNSLEPRRASAAAVSFTTRRLLSRGAVASVRVIVPALDSIEIAGMGAAGGGTLLAARPAWPLKIKPETEPRFSPAMVRSTVVPRWIHSGEMEVILGTGWAERRKAPIRKRITGPTEQRKRRQADRTPNAGASLV